MQIANTLPELIGNTPLLRLERFAPGAGVLAKLESFNPLSSAKDRAGLYMILDAEERGLLQPGAVIVEPTSGTQTCNAIEPQDPQPHPTKLH